MKYGGKLLFCLAGMIVLTPVVRAVVDDAATGANKEGQAEASGEQPYSAIWTRNVFDLTPKPAVIPPDNNKTNLPPPNVKLVGILTIFQKKQAMLTVQDQLPGHPPGKEECYNLTEGERRGGLEVLEIDPKGETVKIKNDELVSTLHFETNHPAGGAPPPPLMGGPHPIMQPPGYTPPGIPNPGNNMTMPSRMLRGPGQSSSPSMSYNGAPNQNLGGVGYGSGYVAPTGIAAPGLAVPGGGYNPTSPVTAPAAPTQVLAPEEQIANYILQHTAAANGELNVPGAPEVKTLPPMVPIPEVQELMNQGVGQSTTPVSSGPPALPGIPYGVKTTGTYH